MAGATNPVRTSLFRRKPDESGWGLFYLNQGCSKVLTVEFQKWMKKQCGQFNFYFKERCYSFASRTASIFCISSFKASEDNPFPVFPLLLWVLITYWRAAIARKSCTSLSVYRCLYCSTFSLIILAAFLIFSSFSRSTLQMDNTCLLH